MATPYISGHASVAPLPPGSTVAAKEAKEASRFKTMKLDSLGELTGAASRQTELATAPVSFFFCPDKQIIVTTGLSAYDSPALVAARENVENVRSAVRRDCSRGQGEQFCRRCHPCRLAMHRMGLGGAGI